MNDDFWVYSPQSVSNKKQISNYKMKDMKSNLVAFGETIILK